MNAVIQRNFDKVAGELFDLTDVEAMAVVYLRIWYSGIEGKRKIQNNFAMGLGQTLGQEATDAFEQLCFFGVQHGCCRISPGALSCRHVNSGEALFANLIANGAFGDRSGLRDVAAVMVGDVSKDSFSALAATVGAAFCQIRNRTQGTWHDAHHPINRPH